MIEMIGETNGRKIIDEVFEEYGKRQDSRAWQIYLHGTHEECDQLAVEIEAAL